MANTFNIGDTVKQVGEYGPGREGEIFEIASYDGMFYGIKSKIISGGVLTGWYPRRFKLVKAKAPEPVVLKKLQPLPARILKHLQTKKTISPIEALAAYGTTRLAAAIFQLRKAGYTINTEYKNDNVGHPYARYWLADARDIAA